MSTFVFAHGSLDGGWAYRDVARLLRAAGHEVFAPTYTGLGERCHLLAREITLATHVEDVTQVLRYEDLRDIVLVGHSYGGMVISGVADRLPERIARLIFLDSLAPEDGEAVVDQPGIEPWMATVRERVATLGDGWLFPPLAGGNPRWSALPFACYTTPLALTNDEARSIPRMHIRCTETAEPLATPLRAAAARVAARGGQCLEIASDHFPMVAMPEDLARLLLSLGDAG